jgi:hypothetical protein
MTDPSSDAAKFEDLLWFLMGATNCDELKERLRTEADTRAQLVAWLTELDVLAPVEQFTTRWRPLYRAVPIEEGDTDGR